MQWVRLGLLSCAVLWLSSCASANATLGRKACPTPLGDPKTASLAVVDCAARRGDKHAQFELASRYANGSGVTRDPKRAFVFLRDAARDVPNVTYVYSPAVGAETYGRTLAMPNGIAEPGLAEAQYALAMVYAHGDGVAASTEQAQYWIKRAAAQGYAPAIAALGKMAVQ